MFPYSLICSLAWLWASLAPAAIPGALVTFLQHAVPAGEIRYWSTFAAPHSVYYVFTLQQAERRGVLVVRQTGQTGFEVIGADTSFDSFSKKTISSEFVTVIEAAARLLNGKNNDPFAARTAASVEDVCPLGAALNALLVPIAGFALSSNGTLGILRDLQHADAYSVDPEKAPPGSILVFPSHFAARGPVIIGYAVVVGPDRCVYGPDYRHSGAWHRLATLREWLRVNQSGSDVRGFLLRAKANDQAHPVRGDPSVAHPL
jgi:hypothetical protein